MFGLSLGHLLILLVIVVFFRARHLPEVAAGIGKAVTLFKRGFNGEDLTRTISRQDTAGVRTPDAILPAEEERKKS